MWGKKILNARLFGLGRDVRSPVALHYGYISQNYLVTQLHFIPSASESFIYLFLRDKQK